MNVLVTGGAGFIGSAYVRHRLENHPDVLGPGARQAHLRRPRARTSRASTRRGSSSSSPTSPTPRPSRRRSTAATRSSTSPPRPTSTARSRRRASSSRPTSSAPTSCSRPPARRASGTCRSPPTRSTARSTRARSPRARRSTPPRPYSASKAGGDLMVGAYRNTYGTEALIVRASNNYGPRQYPEKLIPLCILNALAGDPLPVYGDGMQVRNWLWVDDFASGDRHRARVRRAGRGLQRRRPRRAAQHRGREADPRAHRPRRVADRLRHRPPRPRPPLLARLGEDRGARLEGRGRLRRGDRADGRVVPRERVVVAADPLGRVPRVLRAPVRLGAAADAASGSRPGSTASSCSSRPSTATSAASWSRRFSADGLGARPGVDAEFVQDNHSRSARGILRGLHFQTEPGQAKLVRCLRGRIWDVAVDLRRDSPTYGQWEGYELDDEATASSSSRSGSRTASACSPTSPTSTTSSRATTTRRPRPGSPGTTPTSGSSGRSPTRRSPSATRRAEARRDRRRASLVLAGSRPAPEERSASSRSRQFSTRRASPSSISR